MEALSSFELEVARLLVETLHLEDIQPEDIAPEALELALAISKTYGFQLRSEDKDNRRIFASLRALSQHIAQQRTR